MTQQDAAPTLKRSVTTNALFFFILGEGLLTGS